MKTVGSLYPVENCNGSREWEETLFWWNLRKVSGGVVKETGKSEFGIISRKVKSPYVSKKDVNFEL